MKLNVARAGTRSTASLKSFGLGWRSLASRLVPVVKACHHACPLTLLVAALTLLGCNSVLVSSYVSPRVTGRVLAADTRQPIADVRVRRIDATAQASSDNPGKGGQRLDPAFGVRTDRQGRFVLNAERDLGLLQQQVWYSVTVSFTHEGYQTLLTNFSIVNITANAPDGAPVVNSGDILMHPTSL